MKAVLFDFDGTLANTLPLCFDAFRTVFMEYDQRYLEDNDIKAMFGPSETEIIAGNLIHHNKEEAIELFYLHYEQNHKRLVVPSSEISALLQYIKETGKKMAIVTGKARRSLDISLSQLHMNNLFDVIITGDDVEKPKPDPEGLLKAIHQLGVKPHEAMYIGDSNADLQAGASANVWTAGVHWLSDYQDIEFSVPCKAFFRSVSEYVELLKAEEIGI